MPKEPSRRMIKSLLPIYHWLLSRFAPGGDRPFFDPADFPWVALLEENWESIRAELDQLVAEIENIPNLTEVDPGQDDIASERWKVLMLRVYGRTVPENCERCPATAEVLSQIPDVTLAMFSILTPGSVVPPHYGPFKGVLRCHLA